MNICIYIYIYIYIHIYVGNINIHIKFTLLDYILDVLIHVYSKAHQDHCN